MRWTRFDTVTYLTLWLAFLYGISARQVVPGFGALGSPAMLIALPSLLIWAGGWVMPRSGLDRGRHPIRAPLLIYFTYLIISFGVTGTRPITGLESTQSIRALLTGAAMTGIALLVADGVRDQARLTALLRRVVIAATFVGIIGILQFITGDPLRVMLPGLRWNADAMSGIELRGAFNRPLSTTLHPIEFSAVTAGLLPLAIHFALYSKNTHARRNFGLAAAILAVAIPIAVSRTGVVSLVVAMAVLAMGWSWRRRLNALLIGMAAVPVIWAAIPGIVGTMIGLFSDTDDDASIQARIRRQPAIMALIRERPWLGLGNGSWSVDDYFLIDNQIFVTTLEMGFVGLALTIFLLLLGAGTAAAVRGLPRVDEATAHLALAITASIAGLAITIVTFDAFFYRILTGTLFLLIGAAGALWRMHGGSEHLSERLHRGSRRWEDRRLNTDPGG